MDTEKRSTFNHVAELYNRTRNRYPDLLFNELFHLLQLPSEAHALEIGPGTGIATIELAKYGFRITAVELGAEMAAVARCNLAAFPNVDIQVAPFEEWKPPTEPFDLILSATSFHWIDPEVRYQKTASILRVGGYLAIINYRHVAGGDQSFFDQVQHCYERYMPGTPPNLRLPQIEDIAPATYELEASGLFEKPSVRRYVSEETYSSKQYMDLLSTYSDHRMLDETNRKLLFDCISSLIDQQYGGKVTKRYLNELILTRRC
ncbi:class I SAM-dependent methyltransferase [Paenibacillus mendelii]|uniref:Class I SAM-dependent methyltransferase n=1 Tax=Paenibacillus mendelii TaxID=206163 RepID=A0ABV6JEJ1_9BACL|nr:class I SAM-dependent methyltransferase [Paenibacillus mendelii]MCQ6557203.1 class I SAM-dependent methyltransferase [Paenibacillus mendelii]